MIRAILFDCFGVLTTEGWLPFKREHFGHDLASEQQATDLSKRFNGGHLPHHGFIEQVARLAGVTAEAVRRAIDRNVPNAELFAYIDHELKGRYKLSTLSNAGANQLRQLFTPEQLACFDDAALSFETGYVKPDLRAYAHAAEMLGVAPEECVFIDDQERNCAGAREVGMHAICYTDFEQVRAELETLLASVSGDTED